ncbi:uncharacterized protein LOC144952924 [Lampetra fluviatilis]
MAYAVTTPLLETSGDFTAWLEAQGLNAEVARAMDSELGIRDFRVLRACVRDGLVRAELLATARDRLPFGFYAVLRQVVKDLQGAEPHDDAGTLRRNDAAASSPSDVTLGGLVEVLLALLSGLSRELLQSVQRLDNGDNRKLQVDSSLSAARVAFEDGPAEMDQSEQNVESEATLIQASDDTNFTMTTNQIKMEPPQGVHLLDDLPELEIENVTSLCHARENLTSPANNGSYSQQTAAEIHGEETDASDSVDEKPFPSTMQRRSILRRDTTGTGVSESQNPSVNVGKQTYSCKVCSMKFSKNDDVKIHMRTHTGKRPYSCDVCGKRFTASGQMICHQRMHTSENTHCCTVCGGRFLNKISLKKHRCKSECSNNSTVGRRKRDSVL